MIRMNQSQPPHLVARSEQEILSSNPSVSKHVVQQFSELESQLNLLGVKVVPRYSLSHPLERLIDFPKSSPSFFNSSQSQTE